MHILKGGSNLNSSMLVFYIFSGLHTVELHHSCLRFLHINDMLKSENRCFSDEDICVDLDKRDVITEHALPRMVHPVSTAVFSLF